MVTSSAELAALTAAARHGLPGPERPPVELDAADLDRALRLVRLDRLGGLLAVAMDDGAVRASSETVAAVRNAWHEQLVGSVRVERLAIRVAAVLDDAGARWRLTKGPALAHLDYADPALRTFGDVDVIVHPDSWVAAVEALTEAGWRRPQPELAGGFDERYGKGATLVDADDLEVDLHRRLAIGRFGVRLPTESLFNGVESLPIGGRSLPVLPGSDRLLHACFHAALGGFREWRAHRDVAQLLLVSEVDWTGTVGKAERWRVGAVVAGAVLDTWRILDLEVAHPAHAWAEGRRLGRADARALRVFGEERPFRTQALTAVPALLGRGAGRYLWTLVRQPGR